MNNYKYSFPGNIYVLFFFGKKLTPLFSILILLLVRDQFLTESILDSFSVLRQVMRNVWMLATYFHFKLRLCSFLGVQWVTGTSYTFMGEIWAHRSGLELKPEQRVCHPENLAINANLLYLTRITDRSKTDIAEMR